MLTVLIASHNGADTFGRTLSRLCEIDVPAGGWKLVIVNNASTDATESIALSYSDRLPIDYVVEPRLGKSTAMNIGFERVAGDLVIMTDDDVLPERDWLMQFRAAAERYPDAMVFGGAVEPDFASPPPAWLAGTGWMNVLFAASDASEPEGAMEARMLLGPNMALRSAALKSGVRFDERRLVGPMGLLGDETEFGLALDARGYLAVFVPSAKVRHIVHGDQLRWRWMLNRFYRHGKAMYLTHLRERNGPVPELVHVPRYLIGRAVGRALTAPLVALRLDGFRLFAHLRLLAYDLGEIAQARAGRDGAADPRRSGSM